MSYRVRIVCQTLLAWLICGSLFAQAGRNDQEPGNGLASAGDYPSGPITLLVPFTAGGPSDTLARIVAQSMSIALAQPVNVTNLAGVGGTIGSKSVALAQPNGYTLLFHHIGLATSPHLYSWLPYHVEYSFEPVGLAGSLAMTLVARQNLPPRTLAELIRYIKKNKVTYAHAGKGSASQLCGILLMRTAATHLSTVAYDGTSVAMADLLQGKVDLLCDQTANTIAHIKAGTIKAYALTSPTRLSNLPDLPTTREAGFDDLELLIWNAIYAPMGTPPDVIDKLAAALSYAMNDPAVMAQFAALGVLPATAAQSGPAYLRGYLHQELEKWGRIIRRSPAYLN